jgi:hypothetical protein
LSNGSESWCGFRRERPAASACFFVLAASPTKTVDWAGRAGVHSVSFEGGGGLSTFGVTALMGRLADECRVPPAIIGRVVAIPPHARAWLGAGEKRAMRVHLADLLPIPLPGAGSPISSIGAAGMPSSIAPTARSCSQ